MTPAEVVHLEGQLSIYEDLPHARTSDPATSHAAARRLTDKHTMMRTLLLVFAGHNGLTSEEACRLAGYGAEDGAWKRVSDLKGVGWIEPTGDTRPGVSGRQQAVMVATEQGIEALRST